MEGTSDFSFNEPLKDFSEDTLMVLLKQLRPNTDVQAARGTEAQEPKEEPLSQQPPPSPLSEEDAAGDAEDPELPAPSEGPDEEEAEAEEELDQPQEEPPLSHPLGASSLVSSLRRGGEGVDERLTKSFAFVGITEHWNRSVALFHIVSRLVSRLVSKIMVGMILLIVRSETCEM